MEEEDEYDSDPEAPGFDRDRHVFFLSMMYQLLPSQYQREEINRLTIAYFVISGLGILNALDRIDKEEAVKWVLSLQFRPNTPGQLEDGQFYGFHGSRSSQFQSRDTNLTSRLNGSHLASTYCALCILKILGYDLSLIDSNLLLRSMKNLQQPDGSFIPTHSGGEKDLRFVFCAAAISSILMSWSGIDCQKAKEYILKCQSYDGGFGLTPGSESHGGATYCAVASLKLLGFLEEDPKEDPSSHTINVPLLLDWCMQKQGEDGGFKGRTNKPSDTCYAFWIGGVLRMIGASELINATALRQFLFTCQSKYGGFSKFPGSWPDIYHSFYGISAFGLLNETGVKPVVAELGISEQTHSELGDVID